MIDHDDLASGETQEQNQPLIESLNRFYVTNVEDGQSLSRIRARLQAERGFSQSHSSIDDVIPYNKSLTKSANASAHLFRGAGWRYRLNALAAVLVVTFLVGSLLVLLNIGHHSSSGAGKRAAALQYGYQATPTPLPFLTVPKGWSLLTHLGNTGEMVTKQSFIPSYSWQALLICEGPGQVQIQFTLGNAYTSSLEAKYGLPSEISYTFACNSRAGTQVFPSSPSKIGVLVEVSTYKQSSWRMIIIGCFDKSSACRATNP